jgi:hypothetical protein
MLFGTMYLFLEALKPQARRRGGRSFSSRLQNTELLERKKASESYNAIRNSKHSLKYMDKNSENLNIVYFISNPTLEALKIGVGQVGRINQLINSTLSRDTNGLKVGWQILRLAYFEEMKDAYKAEARVMHHWRNDLKLSECLNAKDMGFSQMKLVNKRVWLPTGGHTETVNMNSICKNFTWNIVLNSEGNIGEDKEYSINQLDHHNCEELHIFNESGFNLSLTNRRIRKKSTSSKLQYSDDELLWSKIQKLDEVPNCWMWNSATTNGYAIGTYKGDVDLIHRVTWKIQFGEIPNKSFLRNDCGSRNCVNPDHWRLEVSQEYECVSSDCGKKSETVTKPGLCKTCRQREKRKRRKERLLKDLE